MPVTVPSLRVENTELRRIVAILQTAVSELSKQLVDQLDPPKPIVIEGQPVTVTVPLPAGLVPGEVQE